MSVRVDGKCVGSGRRGEPVMGFTDIGKCDECGQWVQTYDSMDLLRPHTPLWGFAAGTEGEGGA